PGHHLFPDVRTPGPGPHLVAVPELLEAVAVRVLTSPPNVEEVVMKWISPPLILSLMLGLLVLSFGTGTADAQAIKIGNLVDLTGPTSDQGKDIAQGRNDAVQYINEKGGVNGRKLELVSVEYGFQPPRAVAAYKKFVEDDKVLLVLGYGTPDTEALRP